jgi:hypothetical protein
MAKATKLKGLLVDRVDLVDIGANLDKRTGDGAHIMLFKRAADAVVCSACQKAQKPDAKVCADCGASMGGEKKSAIWRVADLAKAKGASAELIAKAEQMARSFDEILAGRIAQRALDSLWDLYYAFMESARSIFESDEADKIGLLRESAVDFMNAFLGALPDAVDDAAVEKVGRKISASRMKQLTEMHAKLGSLLKEVSGEDDTMKIADFAKSLGLTVAEDATPEQIKKAVDDHIAAQVIAKGAPAVPADVQKALDAQKADFDAQIAKRDEQIAKAQADAKAERDARILKQFEAQAASEFLGLPLQLQKAADKPESKTDAEIFKALAEKAPEEWLRVEAILKGAAEAIRVGKLFEETGAGGAGSAGSALEQINQLAKALVDAKSEKTIEQAIAKVSGDPAHRELYSRYVAEQRQSH